MADPTLSDVMAELAAVKAELDLVKLQNTQQTSLLNAISTGVQIMSQQVDDETAAETVLSGKVDQVLAALAAGRTQNTNLQTQIAALQAQIAQLQANGSISAADAAKLTAATTDMQAKSAAIDAALTPPTPPPAG